MWRASLLLVLVLGLLPVVGVRDAEAGPGGEAPKVRVRVTPASGVAPLEVRFDALASSDPDGGAISVFRWDFEGDGTVDVEGPQARVSHTYGAGVYQARVTVVDDEGMSVSKTVRVRVENAVPVASLAVSYDKVSMVAPLRADFDASASSDANGTIVSYAWDFDGDGTVDDSSGPVVSHVYETAGVYTARLVVTDDLGATAEAVELVGVLANESPTAFFGVTPAVGLEAPVRVSFDASASSDPEDGTAIAYAWDFDGDGSVDSTEGPEAIHRYAAAGLYPATLTVTDSEGASSSFVRLLVVGGNAAPTVTVRTDVTGGVVPLSVFFEVAGSDVDGDEVTFELTPGDGSAAVPVGESVSHTYTATGVFSAVVTARDRAGATATATVEVTVGAAPVLGEQVRDPGVVSNVASIAAGLYEGDAPVQTGVDVDMLDPADVAIARGQVLDQAGNPLSGARVSVRDQDGFGETYSRADGWWDMAVTAGQRLTFDVAKAGFVAAQRSMEPRAGRFEIADATVLVPYDTAVTDIDFDAPIEVARGSVVTDDRGTRQQTVLFQAGTEAKMQRSDGSWETLDEISVRATEFTVGASGRAAMPGELPETVMYNYAAEFSVDEARLAGDDTASVSFSKPVFSYTDNFTGWADGTVVPCGYYNRETGFWEACENSGIALTILDATTDSDGDGIAEVTLNTDTDPDVDAGADLDGDGTDDTDIGADERETLATLYGAGTSLWRVTLQHFSPYDFNPGWIIGAAQKPDIDVDGGFDQLGKGCTMPGSVIECENQTLGETVAVAGTDSTLNYRSSRVPGRTDDRTLDISLPPDGQTVPDGVVGACLTVGVGGVGHSTGALMADSGGFWENTNWLCGGAAAVPSDDPGWEQIDATHFRFTWDGLDAYGYALNGVQDIEIRATYYYCADLTAGGFGFVDADDIITLNVDTEPNPLYGCPVAGIPTIMGQRIGHYSAPVTEFGGWSLDSHHVYDPAQGILYYGDGSFRDLDPGAANSAGAGFQMSYYADVPRDEDEDSASKVQGIAVSESEVYVGDTGTDQIWKASASSPERIAEHINVSGGLTMGGGGLLAGVYRQVMEVNTYDGSFEPYAGCIHELPPYPDCMEPSTEWSDPELVTMSPVDIEGHYVADSAGRLLVFRETDDGGVEVKELVDTATPPTAIAANAAGVYWSDGRVVYRVDSFGNVTVVAGQWDDPYGCERSEDSGLATDACLDAVHGLAVSGSMLFIADSGEAKIRAVSLNSGRIYTAAGTGVAELDPPNSCNGNYCEIWDLWPIEATDDGDVFFTDDSGTIRRLTTIAPVFDGSDIAIPSEDGSLLYQFDAYGRHLRTLDAFTLETLLTFDYESGLLSSVTDAFGRTLDIDRDWYTITLTSPDGGGSQITTLTPTGSIGGYLDTIAYPGGYSIDLTHADVADPQAGLLTGLVDPAGGNHTFFYDDDGRLYLDRAPDGGSTGLTRIPLEGTSPYEDDHYEVLVTKLHDDSPADMMVSTLTVEQGEAGTTRTFTGPDGLVTTSVADATGTVVSRVDADGTTSRVESTGDPRWGMLAPYPMSVDVDVPGRGRQSVDTARSYSYVVESGVVASATQDVTFTDADGGTRTVTSEYDWDPATAEGTVASGTPEGRTDTMTLDRYGRPVGYDPAPIDGVDQAPVAVEYDALGRVDTVSEGSRVTDYDYYTSGESPGDLWEGALKSVTDPTGRTGTVVGYDALLRPLNTQGPDGTTSGVRYDDNGNITRVLMPSSGDDHDTHVYDYDSADRPIGYNPPDIEGPDGATGATWNLDGTPDSAYDADGRSATSTYTPGTGRLDCVDYDSDAAETADVDESRDCTTVPEGAAHLAYNPNDDAHPGYLAGVTDGTSSFGFAYEGTLLDTVEISGDVTGRIGLGYNGRLELDTFTLDGGTDIAYSYDDDGLPDGVGPLDLTLDPASGALVGTQSGEVADTYGYDAYGALDRREVTASGDTLYEQHVTDTDELGRITAVTETLAGDTTSYNYTYTDAGEIDTVTRDGVQIADYSYDDHGNRTCTVDGDPATTEYNVQDQLRTCGTDTYRYTPSGRLADTTDTATGAVTRYSYDDQVGDLTAVGLPDGTTVAYSTDVTGNLATRTETDPAGATVDTDRYLYAGGLQPVAQVAADGTVEAQYVYATAGHVPDIAIVDGATYRLVTDSLGSVRAVVDTATGAVVQSAEYDTWGNTTRQRLYDSDGDLVCDTATDDCSADLDWQPFGYAGGITDPATGLVHFGARWYDPHDGRWITKDPIGLAGGLDVYAYAGNDPVNYIDPSGLAFYNRQTHTDYDGLPQAVLDELDRMGHGTGIPRLNGAGNQKIFHDPGGILDGAKEWEMKDKGWNWRVLTKGRWVGWTKTHYRKIEIAKKLFGFGIAVVVMTSVSRVVIAAEAGGVSGALCQGLEEAKSAATDAVMGNPVSVGTQVALNAMEGPVSDLGHAIFDGYADRINRQVGE